mgnify:CR=1 FL=1
MEHIVVNEIESRMDAPGNDAIISAIHIMTPMSTESTYPNKVAMLSETYEKTTTKNVSNIAAETNGSTSTLARSAYTDIDPNVYILYGSVAKYAAHVVTDNSRNESDVTFGNTFLIFVVSGDTKYTMTAVARKER